MELLRKKVIPFEMIKISALKVDMQDITKWGDEINRHMSQVFPFLSEGLRPVVFSEKDAESGNAIGTVAWRNGDKSITIPVIIDDYRFADPDLATMGDKVIPLDENFIKQLLEQDMQGEVNYETEPSEQMDYISSIFDPTEMDSRGNPYGIKIASSTRDKIVDVLSKFPDTKFMPEDSYAKLKTASCMDQVKIPIDCLLYEEPDSPYHYSGAILYKSAGKPLEVENVSHKPEGDVKKLRDDITMAKAAEYLYLRPDRLKSEMPQLKLIAKNGRHQVIVDNKERDAVAFVNLYSIDGNSSSKALVIVNKDGECIKSSGDPVEWPPALAPTWQYGEIYGKDNEPNRETREIGDSIIELDKFDNSPIFNEKYIVFVVSKGNLSVPYKMAKYEEYKIGSKGDVVKLADLESMASGAIIRVWLGHNITKPVLANKEKMRDSEYKALMDTSYPIYLLPANYEIYELPGKPTQPAIAGEYLKDILAEKIASFNGRLTLSDSSAGLYSINVCTPVEGIVHSDLDKTAALLYIRNYMGSSIEKLAYIQLDKEYDIKLPESHKDVDLAPLDKYRGEWMKLAYCISHDDKLLKTVEYINKGGAFKSKVADVSDVVKSLSNIEYADNDNIGGVKNILPLLEEVLDRVGQLLLISRLSKIDLSEPILARAFKAVTELHNEIKGENTNNE